MRKYFSKHYWGDRDIQNIIGNMLRIGVWSSATVVAIGGLLYLFSNGLNVQDIHSDYVASAESFTNFSNVWQGMLHMQPLAIIQLGVLLLIATPIARVIFSFIAFWLEKDYLYVFITLIVLAIIAVSMLSGVAV